MNAVPEDDDVAGQVEEGGEEVTTEQFEKDAREMGWRPKSEWDGPEGKWIDAKTFIERGDQIMPILRANNKKMREELLTKDKDVVTLKESLATAQKAIKALQKGHSEATKREVEIAIADLKERYKQAREVGDVDLELEVRDNLDTLKAKVKEINKDNEEDADTPTKKEVKKDDDKSAELSPEYLEWASENKWFGNEANKDDKARSDALLKIAGEIRKGGDTTTVGRPFMEKCMKILVEREEGYSRPRSKVESGGRPSGGGGGRAWDNLPKEAKAICHEDNEAFVGPGKMFKTVKEWEDHYANLFNQGQ